MNVLICLDCGKIKSRKGQYCKSCGYKHRLRPKGLKYNIKIQNKGWLKKGSIPWHAGKRGPFTGKTYEGLHSWVERNLGKPKICWSCSTTTVRIYQWSNISGLYKKDLSDWQRLCVKCHHRYDYEKFGARKAFYT